MTANPHEHFLIDAVSGIEYSNPEWLIWRDGWDAGNKYGFKRGIKAAVDAINKEGGYIES